MLEKQTLDQANSLFNLLHRHFVAIHVVFEKDGQHSGETYSGFLLSVSDEWVLVTAGHCLDRVQEVLDAGYKIHESSLIDGLASDSRYRHPIPFAYLDSDPVSLDSEGFDCGILRLTHNQRQLLEANAKRPLTEEVWYKQPCSSRFVAARRESQVN